MVYQTPLFIGFPRQEYWSELPFTPVSPALVGGFFTTEPPRRPFITNIMFLLFCPVGLIAECMVANVFP